MNRVQIRDDVLQPHHRVTGGGLARPKDTHFCYIQGMVEKFYRTSRMDTADNRRSSDGKTYQEVAQLILDHILAYVGPHIVLQLICYESVDQPPEEARSCISHLNDQADIIQLCSTWLCSLSPLFPHIRQVSLDLAVTDTRPVKSGLKSIILCEAIDHMFPELEMVYLHLHISREQIELAIDDDMEQGWVIACRTLAGRLRQERLKIFLTEIEEDEKIFWKNYGSSKDPWSFFLLQRKKRNRKESTEDLNAKEASLKDLFVREIDGD
jgi:hypothetical protein